MSQRKCRTCGKPLPAGVTRKQFYCPDSDCRRVMRNRRRAAERASARVVERGPEFCAECGNPIIERHERRKYCGDACREAVARRRRQDYYQRVGKRKSRKRRRLRVGAEPSRTASISSPRARWRTHTREEIESWITVKPTEPRLAGLGYWGSIAKLFEVMPDMCEAMPGLYADYLRFLEGSDAGG